MTIITGQRPVPGPHSDDPFALWDAAYVLNALSADERRKYEAHLSGCVSCRAAVSEISDVPPVLALLSADEVIALDENTTEPPPLRPQVLDSLVDEVASRRRRSRWVTTAAASLAAALLAIGLLIVARPGTIGLEREEPAPATVAMEQVKPAPVEASVALISKGWGTFITMTCTYGQYSDRDDRSTEFAMVLVQRDGDRTEAATWTAQPGTSVTVDGSTSTPVDQIAAVQLVDIKTGDVLLQRNL
jgi:anti-sigma factor RsiW